MNNPGDVQSAVPSHLGARRAGPTDDELAAVLRWIVRLLLEVERGYRPTAVLRRFLAPHLLFDLESAARAPGAPSVAERDVGGARFQRIGRRRGFGVVVIKEADGQWAALMLTLVRDDAGAWRVVEITRPHGGGRIDGPALPREGDRSARR